MDYGVPFRVVAEAAGKFVVATGGCKITGLYCASVGQTGLPTDPPPEPTIPVVSLISPTFGPEGTEVTISGSGFGTEPGTVRFGEVEATVVSWADTEIVASVVKGANVGGVEIPVTVTNPQGDSNANFMFLLHALPLPVVSGVTPISGQEGIFVSLSGTGFGATQGTSKVQIGGVDAPVSQWAENSITVVPALGANVVDTPAPVTVITDAGTSNADIMFTFTVPAVVADITGVAPTSGPDMTEITITGIGFGASQGAGWVVVGNDGAIIVSWSDTQIVIGAMQGSQDLDVALPITIQTLDGQQVTEDAAFTFTTAAARGSSTKKAAKKTSRHEVKVEEPKAEEKSKRTSRDMGKADVREVERAAGDGFPAFDSGAGFMLIGSQNAGAKIYLGPTELKAGQQYPIDMNCSNGLDVEVNGPCDFTVFLVR